LIMGRASKLPAPVSYDFFVVTLLYKWCFLSKLCMCICVCGEHEFVCCANVSLPLSVSLSLYLSCSCSRSLSLSVSVSLSPSIFLCVCMCACVWVCVWCVITSIHSGQGQYGNPERRKVNGGRISQNEVPGSVDALQARSRKIPGPGQVSSNRFNSSSSLTLRVILI
jgi:hypothetical protein